MSLRIDRYQVQRLIGQGAMGKVYLAVDPKLGRQVAVKVIAATSADEGARRRFRLEARAIAALKHPNIVELYDYSGESAVELFLVMEFIPGPSLDTLVRQHGNVSEPTALCIGHELCLALAHAHHHKVVHRDLKPENVLLHNGRVVLTDFGIVKALAASTRLGVANVSPRTQVVGTPGFMAPEQLAGKQIDERTDVFALGALLYCVTTGKVPFEGESIDDIHRRLKDGRVTPARQHNPLLSPGFGELVERCLATRPKDRFEGAEEVRAQILALLASHGVSEVRQELAFYEANPATYALEQRRRSIDVLLRDLQVALNDRDEDMAQTIRHWIETLAPLDERLRELSGFAVPSPRSILRAREPWLRRPLVLSAVAGAVVGALFSAAIDLRALMPAAWVDVTEAVLQWLSLRP